MPNHVTNKLLFQPADGEKVIAVCCPDGQCFDFETLVPSPPHMYHGSVSKEEQEDFPLNWLDWCTENWGTKWNAYAGEIGTNDEDGRVFIQFDTAWSLPYPVLVALANKFNVAFEHRYFDEGHNFWGVEMWSKGRRLTKRASDPKDKRPLCMELKGYDPDNKDE